LDNHFGEGLAAPEESKGAHIGWVIGAIVLFGGILTWGYLDQNNYFYHTKPTHISSAEWNADAKECLSWNRKIEAQVLECDGGHNEVKLDVPVRFYGNTERPLDPETVRLRWMCRKDGGVSAAIACRVTP
jgi:hypothetical protein